VTLSSRHRYVVSRRSRTDPNDPELSGHGDASRGGSRAVRDQASAERQPIVDRMRGISDLSYETQTRSIRVIRRGVPTPIGAATD
jgi:hypothetical protein